MQKILSKHDSLPLFERGVPVSFLSRSLCGFKGFNCIHLVIAQNEEGHKYILLGITLNCEMFVILVYV